MMAAQDFQGQFDVYQRPDENIPNVRCYCVDPGLVRTSMSRGFLSFGSIGGLLVYLIMWPLWFIVLKSEWQGAQTILHCAMRPIEYDRRGEGGWKAAGHYRDCREAKYQRDELLSVEACEELRKRTDKDILDAEKRSAVRRKIEQAQVEQARAQPSIPDTQR